MDNLTQELEQIQEPEQTRLIKASAQFDTYELPLDKIFADCIFNCRGRFAPIDVQDLVVSINKIGLQDAIVVQPWVDVPGKEYRIISGHRRAEAVRQLGFKTIPAKLALNLSVLDAALLNLVENVARKDLNILQEANGIKPFVNAGWRPDIIAAEVGTSRGWVETRILLLKMPEDVQMEVAAGLINQSQLKELYTLKDKPDELYKAIRLIKERREKGEVVPSLIMKRVEPYRAVFRQKGEIFEMQALIQKVIGDSLATVLAGWCAGVVNDYEMHKAVRSTAKLCGVEYKIPKEMIDKL